MKLRHRGYIIVVIDVVDGFAARIFEPMQERRFLEDVYGRNGWQALELAQALIDRWIAKEQERLHQEMGIPDTVSLPPPEGC